MYSKDQKYFHFHATFVCMAWFILTVSSFEKPNMQQSCFEVAEYVEKWLMHEDPITMVVADAKFLNNFALCVRHVQKLVKQSDWAAIQKIIPPRVHSFLKTVSSQTLKDGLSLAGKGGLQVVSFYVFYQSVELYKRAVSLEIDYQRYHNEFEFLRTKKILPIMEQIERDILQQLEIRDTASSINLSKKLIKELGDYNTELRAMLKLIYKDYKEARTGAVGSVGYSIAAGCVCAGSLVVGWPVYIIPCILGVATIGYNILSMSSFINTVDLLQALQNDVEKLSGEIADYCIILNKSDKF